MSIFYSTSDSLFGLLLFFNALSAVACTPKAWATPKTNLQILTRLAQPLVPQGTQVHRPQARQRQL